MVTLLVTVEVVIFLLLAAYMLAFALSFSPVILADVISRARTSVSNRWVKAVRLWIAVERATVLSGRRVISRRGT
jgi:hypothetical protein